MSHTKAKSKPALKKSGSSSSAPSPVTASNSHGTGRALNSSAGNFYSAAPVFGLKGPAQPKVAVGKANDPYEQEADRVADKVTDGLPAPLISSLPSTGLNNSAQRQEKEEEEPVQTLSVQRQEKEEEEPVQTLSVQRQEEEKEEPVQTLSIQRQKKEEEEPVQTLSVQRQEEEEEEPVQTMAVQRQEEEEEESVQTDAGGGTGAGPSMAGAAAHAINTKGPGSPLNPSVRNTLESRMGTDFSNVRVHDDSGSREAADKLNARAFTHKNDIWLGKGASGDDLGLMAHEATHVVQQQSAVQRQVVQKDGNPPAATPAPAADANAGTDVAGGDNAVDAVTNNDPATLTSGAGTIDTRNKKIEMPLISLPEKGGKAAASPKPLTIPKTYNRSTDQREKWYSDIRGNGVDSKVDTLLPPNKAIPTRTGEEIFYLKLMQQNSFLIGDKNSLKTQLKLPNWTERGSNFPFDVDHIHELQLGGANDISNYQLLDPRTNRASGPAIAGEIRRRIRAAIAPHVGPGKHWQEAPDPDEIRTSYNETKFTNVDDNLEVVGPNISWSVEQVGTLGVHHNALEVLDAAAVRRHRLRGSATRLLVYMSRGAGQPKPINWNPNANGSQNFRRRNWSGIKGFDLTNITYNPGESGTMTGNVFSSDRNVVGGPLTFDLIEVPGLPYTVRAYTSSITARMRNLLKAKKTSPIELFDADIGDNGIMGRGVIHTTLPFLKDVDIDLNIDGGDVMFSKTFTSGDFDIPGPVDIKMVDFTLGVGTRGLEASGGVEFEVERVGSGRIGARASTGEDAPLELEGHFDFDSEFFDRARIELWYRDETFGGSGQLAIGQGKVKGIRSATIDVTVNGEAWEATGTVEPNIPGVRQGTLTAQYDPEKGFVISGSLILGDDVPGIKGGTLTATVAQKEDGSGYSVKASGDIPLDIPGVDANISAEYDDGAFTARGSVAYEKGMLKGSITAGVTNRAVDEEGNPSGEPTETLTVFGSGSLTIRIAPWLQGTVGVKLLPNGEIEVSGEIGIPESLEIFPEKRYDKNIFTIGIDIPIVGVAVAGQRIGIFANISGGLDLTAGFGPGTLENVRLGITYNPAHEEETTVTGSASFVVPADAGLRLFVRGSLGVGIPIVSASAGLEIGGQLGLEGEARADVDVNWNPGTGLALDATGSIMVQPVFKFDITGFVMVEADLLLTTVELYSKRWQLASFEYGSGMQFGVRFPIRYREGEPFDISLDDVEFITPEIDAGELLRGLIARIA